MAKPKHRYIVRNCIFHYRLGYVDAPTLEDAITRARRVWGFGFKVSEIWHNPRVDEEENMQTRTAHEDWKATALALAIRVAALQSPGETDLMEAEEIRDRAYEMTVKSVGPTCRQWKPTWQRSSDEALLFRTWKPSRGQELYYGELTNEHLNNIITWIKEKMVEERTQWSLPFVSRRGHLLQEDRTPAQSRWANTLNGLLRLRQLRERQG